MEAVKNAQVQATNTTPKLEEPKRAKLFLLDAPVNFYDVVKMLTNGLSMPDAKARETAKAAERAGSFLLMTASADVIASIIQKCITAVNADFVNTVLRVEK